jgi:hypothetical protein
VLAITCTDSTCVFAIARTLWSILYGFLEEQRVLKSKHIITSYLAYRTVKDYWKCSNKNNVIGQVNLDVRIL